ncbi:MAG: translocation/assembly module TamB domain-containing protein [Sulfitobacter sp.]
MRMIRFALLAIALLIALPLAAQEGPAEEDKGYLTRKIQELLSGAGREVEISGFTGALSSSASFSRMTISDADGVWLSMEDVVLDWNRSALLGGRLEVEQLSAARIDIPRLPKSEGTTLPEAEATPFTLPTLPELPVSIDIAALTIAELRLGAPLVGEEVTLQMTAKATLGDEGLDAAFVATRTNGKRGRFDVTAALARGDDVLDLQLELSEAKQGLVSNLLNIPGAPSIDMTIKSAGPLTHLETDLALKTDGQTRLSGLVTLITQGDAADPDRRVVADIGGDITAIVLPEYRAFFGEDISLAASALIAANGAISVDDFTLKADAVDLAGRVALSEDKWPTLLDINGRVARVDGTPVLLPGGGGDTYVEHMNLDIQYDAANADAYEAVFDLAGVETSAGTVAQTTLRSTGTLVGAKGNVGQLRGAVQFAAQGVDFVDAALAEAVGTALEGSHDITYITDRPFKISNLDLHGSDYSLTGDATFHGLDDGLEIALNTMLRATDLSRFSALAGRELDGATSLMLEGSVVPLSGAFDLKAVGTADDIKTGVAQADALLAGRTDVTLTAIRNQNGTFLRNLELNNPALRFTGVAELRSEASYVDAEILLRDIATVLPQYQGPVTLKGKARQNDVGWWVDVAGDGPYATALTVKGLATGADAMLDFSGTVPEVSDFAEGISGPAQADGTLRQTPQGWLLQTNASGPFDATARLNGLVTPAVDLGFEVAMPQVSALAAGVNGPLRATGRLRQTDDGFSVQTDVSGPYGADVAVQGAITPAVDVQFNASLPNLASVAPQLSGALRATGGLRQTDQGFVIDTNADGPYNSRATVKGLVTGDDAAVDFTLAVPNLSAVVPNLKGPLNVNGSAGKTAQGWQLESALRGPAGTQSTVAGLVGNDGNLGIALQGTAPLGLAGPFIRPRDWQGQARFDLRLDGPAGLDALSGTIQTSGATLTAPTLRTSLENLTADVRLSGGRAAIDVRANAVSGGRLAVNGGVALTGAQQADINITLTDIVLLDPRLYRSQISGALRFAGPISGGAGITGTINVGETNVTVPSTGLTSIGDIPEITHIAAPANNRVTRRRAGLLGEGSTSDPEQSSSGGRGYGLNINVNAPGRIFVRGRGLDAELGGSLQITGNTNNVLSSGRFELERGRLDILGKRFDLEEGYAQFQGDFIPYIRFVSTTSTDTGTASVIVEGFADAPEVSFESTPEGPEDEVLAQLLFGHNISDISAFQALQLANAVATLAGRGGVAVVGDLRDKFGLDDLDVSTNDDGETEVSVGKYLTDEIYTEATTASDGTSEVSLNIDLTPNLKGKATLGSDGDSSIGIFFEKDY